MTPTVAVANVVHDKNGNVLLMRSNKRGAEGLYLFPGGKVDSGEYLNHAFARELKEETGLIVLDYPKFLGYTEHPSKLPQYKGYFFLTMFFLCESYAGEVTNKEPDKCQALEWYNIDKLAALPVTHNMRLFIDGVLPTSRHLFTKSEYNDERPAARRQDEIVRTTLYELGRCLPLASGYCQD
jgi:8-oxo-dGTP diphosphatase